MRIIYCLILCTQKLFEWILYLNRKTNLIYFEMLNFV